MTLPRLIALVLPGLLLAACQSSPSGTGGALARNTLACRSPATVTSLHDAGARFQRVADDAMASGACRLFPAGHVVRSRRTDQSMLRFTDPGTGFDYWAYPS